MPLLLDFDHIPMAGKVATGKLWQTDIIKIVQGVLDKMNKREATSTPYMNSKEINGE